MQNLSVFYRKALELSPEQRGFLLVDVIREHIIFGIELDDNLRLRFVKHLLLLGADPDSSPIYNINVGIIPQPGEALYFCCEKGYLDIANILLEFGANPDLRSESTCLDYNVYIAVLNGYTEILKSLLKYGARICTGEYLLYIATLNGYYDIIKVLMDNGVNPPKSYDELKFLLNTGVHIDTGDNLLIRTAAANGYVDIVRLLLEHIWNFDMEDNEPIILAVKNGHNDVVKLLIEHDKEKNGLKEKHILAYAVRNNHIDIIKTLLDAGSDVYDSGAILFSCYFDDKSKYSFLEFYFDDPTKTLLRVGADFDVIAELGPFVPNTVLSDREAYELIQRYKLGI